MDTASKVGPCKRPRPVALRLDCSKVNAEVSTRGGLADIPVRSIEQYLLLEPLGQGTTGVVYEAKHRDNGQHVALKVMRIDDEELFQTARNEYELLRGIRHPKIVRALDFFRYEKGAVLVLEHFAGSTLDMAIQQLPERRLGESCSQRLFLFLLQAVHHLHQQGIIHRDVKAQNILVSGNLQDLKLVDFNTAKSVLDGALTMTGTADYLPPEVLLGNSLTEGSDIWAMGMCLRMMLTGSLPIKRKLFTSHKEFGHALLESTSLSDVGGVEISAPCFEVLQKCLTTDPDERPGAASLLECRWFGEIAA